jgi:lysophospholipase L1-like esterase
MAHFLIFGDSIVYGSWDKAGGWVQRLRAFIEEKYPEEHFVYNLGVSADTTNSLLEKLEFETQQRESERNHRRRSETMLIFQIGINDSAILSTKKDFWVIQSKFKDNIKEIIKISREFSQKIFFVGATPVDEDKTQPVPWDKRVTYKNENIRKYNEMTKEVCNKESVPFIEVFDKFYKSDYKKLLQDGLHPNSEGHENIFEIVRDFLVEKNVI